MHTIRQKVAGEHYSIQTFELSRLCRQFSVQNQFSLVTKSLFGGKACLDLAQTRILKTRKVLPGQANIILPVSFMDTIEQS